MIEIMGYELVEELHVSATSRIFRGRRVRDDLPVIVKTPVQRRPDERALARIHHEFEIGSRFDHPHIVRFYALEPLAHGVALVQEDIGGILLNQQQTPGTWRMSDFLQVAVQLADGLAAMHDAEVIHGNIKVSNIIYSPAKHLAKLIDFGSAALLDWGSHAVEPNGFICSSSYMSPEQTGRMNRLVDYRTDFYSLGVTFYEMLTGLLPFRGRDQLEMAYGHIVRLPVPPHELHPGVPRIVSDLVMRLLAKEPESRYQSAHGLKADLERCFNQVEQGNESHYFELGRSDFSDKFRLPQKLYGRDEVLNQLLGKAREALTEGPLLLLVKGPAGVGKSSLVGELQKPLLSWNVLYAAGKFESNDRLGPHAAIVRAFRDLISGLQREHESALAEWRRRFEDMLEGCGRIMTDLVPELTQIIGRQPALPEVTSLAFRDRFRMIFRQFVGTLATEDHPLLLFLDDLQWADEASLELLEFLLADQSMNHLCLVAAYRDEAYQENTKLTETLRRLKHSPRVTCFPLTNLGTEEVTQMLCDTTRASEHECHRLAEQLMEKTLGNPFFLHEYLQSLYREGYLHYEESKGRWSWRPDEIHSAGISDNVETFLIGRLKKLPMATQRLIGIAACIGDQFDLDTLAAIARENLANTVRGLWPATNDGVIIPSCEDVQERLPVVENALFHFGRRYHFHHNRVRRAAYEILTSQEQQRQHLRIGAYLQRRRSLDEPGERIFEIVGQLDRGRSMVDDVRTGIEMAHFNLEAARQAKRANALQAALEYLHIASLLMPVKPWDTCYELIKATVLEQLECLYLIGDLKGAENQSEILHQHVANAQERAEICYVQAHLCALTGEPERAISHALEGLDLLDHPLKTARFSQAFGLVKLKLRIRHLGCEPLLGLSPMEHAQDLLTMRLLAELFMPAFISGNQALISQITLSMVTLTLRAGICPESVFALTLYAGLIGRDGDGKAAMNLGRIALRLLDRFSQHPIACRTLFMYAASIHHWHAGWNGLMEPLERAISAGQQAGDLFFLSASVDLARQWCKNGNLNRQQRQVRDYLGLFEQTSESRGVSMSARAVRQFRACLQGHTEGLLSLNNGAFRESAYLAELEARGDIINQARFHLLKLKLSVIFGKLSAGYYELCKLEELVHSFEGLPWLLDYHFFAVLLTVRLLERPDGADGARLRKTLRHHEAWLNQLAGSKSKKFAFHAHLGNAEISRLHGDKLAAANAFADAVRTAHDRGLIHYEAMANEWAGNYYRQQGQERVATLHYTEAHHLYERWGARAKQEQMIRDGMIPLPANPANGVRTPLLDMVRILKSTRAIAGETDYDRLLTHLMRILLQSAGARRGVLVLEDEHDLMAEATGQGEEIRLHQGPMENCESLPHAMARYVMRTGHQVLLHNSKDQGMFTSDIYIATRQPRSVLCLPMRHEDQIVGLVYLENNLAAGVFSSSQAAILEQILSQATVALENARAHRRMLEINQFLEKEVARRKLAELEAQQCTEQLEVRMAEKNEELARVRQRLMERANGASLNQATASVLHNVGNILNSVVTSGQVIKSAVRNSKTAELAKANRLLRMHIDHFEEFVREDPRGKTLLDYYLQLGDFIREENRELVDNVSRLIGKINVIREVITAQQSHGEEGLIMEEMYLPDLVDEALGIMANTLERHQIEVETCFDRPPHVPVQRTRFLHLILNLLKNAKEAMHEVTPTRRKICIGMKEEDAYLVVWVEDTGMGFDPALTEQIFEEGYTTKKRGNGFGLHSCRGAIAEMGGEITAASEGSGQGATFYLRFPLLVDRNEIACVG